MTHMEIISQHKNVALQLSGGRDSIACLYLLKPYWEQLTVYWLDPGASYPETTALMHDIEKMVPRFVRIDGRQQQTISDWGMPSDIVPVSGTPIGVEVAGGGVRIQDRYMCCFRSIMLPMQERMIADGVTLIIRGQKNSDKLKAVTRSGEVSDGIQYLFPIEDWTAADVMKYLREQKAPIPRFYEMLNSAPNCMNCTAYWEEQALSYQRRYHHAQFLENQERLNIIREAIDPHIFAFNKEFSL